MTITNKQRAADNEKIGVFSSCLLSVFQSTSENEVKSPLRRQQDGDQDPNEVIKKIKRVIFHQHVTKWQPELKYVGEATVSFTMTTMEPVAQCLTKMSKCVRTSKTWSP